MTDRAALLSRYRELVLTELPARARTGGWVVHADHCFGRIVLDHAVGGRWYDVSTAAAPPPSPSWTTASSPRRSQLAERMAVEGDPLVRTLDAQSLAWRGKRPKRASA